MICGACNIEFVYIVKFKKTRSYCSNKCSSSIHNNKRHRSIPHYELNDKQNLERLSNLLNKNTKKTDGCWLWTSSRSKHGYGHLRWKNKYISAHRASYMLFHGEIQKNLVVCHKCDNPPCVNPDHLFIGTRKDNMQDMIKKGRAHFVAQYNHPMKKINFDIAEKIRMLIKNKEKSICEISKEFNLSKDYIYNIKNNKVWKKRL